MADRWLLAACFTVCLCQTAASFDGEAALLLDGIAAVVAGAAHAPVAAALCVQAQPLSCSHLEDCPLTLLFFPPSAHLTQGRSWATQQPGSNALLAANSRAVLCSKSCSRCPHTRRAGCSGTAQRLRHLAPQHYLSAAQRQMIPASRAPAGLSTCRVLGSVCKSARTSQWAQPTCAQSAGRVSGATASAQWWLQKYSSYAPRPTNF